MVPGSFPHWRAISSVVMRRRGMKAPYPAIPAMSASSRSGMQHAGPEGGQVPGESYVDV